jgi:putative transposase
MSRSTEKTVRTQEPGLQTQLGARVSQMLLPVMSGLLAAKESLLGFMQEIGEQAVREVFESEVTALAGPKGKHHTEREMNRWGRVTAEFPLGGRRITLERPRVRRKVGGRSEEVVLESVRQFQANDPMPEHVLNQVLLGVSTRGYEGSLEKVPEVWDPHGTSKSAASRHLIARTSSKVIDYLARPLQDVKLLALMIDGVVIADHTLVVALGITEDGRKEPLGLAQGSTENAQLCTNLLQDLLARGLRVEERVLCVIDGARGIRKALQDVFGDLAVIQRCQLHKRRNILGLVPERCHAYVLRRLKDAYASSTADTARKQLRALAEWLERDGHDSAAASLREGMEETLTVVKLGLSAPLRQFFATTNAIENVMGTVRRVARNVKHWRKGDMRRRWVGLGLIEAGKKFRRIKCHRSLSVLIKALRGDAQQKLDAVEEAA